MNRKKKKNIFSIIFIIIMITITIIVYEKYGYDYYLKGISEVGKTTFSRDSKITTNKYSSYKIENKDYTDAMFYREISVNKNTPYKVTCMVKTDNVEQYENMQVAGAQIVLKNTEEHSEVLSGTNEWTKLEFCFNSKDNSSVQIGFRLGGNTNQAKGIAWFSNMTIEEGFESTDSKWNFACFVFDNLNVKLDNGTVIKESLTSNELYYINQDMQRFKTTIPELSQNQIQVNYTIIEISDPITTLSYDEDNGYYVSEDNVYNLINKYIEKSEYDHIFACFKLPDESKLNATYTEEWVGLGNMEYCGKGFSDIRIPVDNDYEYIYSNNNTFPEEVFVHEFLHTLERNSSEYGYDVPVLHDYQKYGYEEDIKNGLKKWYNDYMSKKIKYNNSYVGIASEIYTYKPVQLSDFTYSSSLDALDEPKNAIEHILSIANQIKTLFTKTSEQKEITFISN